ncbi:hypothetical protein IAT38_005708 [Cryptococcus sp. DSM 104549]
MSAVGQPVTQPVGQPAGQPTGQPTGQPVAQQPKVQAPQQQQQPPSTLAAPVPRPPQQNSTGPPPPRPPVPTSSAPSAPGATQNIRLPGQPGYAAPGQAGIQHPAVGGPGGAPGQPRPIVSNPTALSSHSRAKATDLMGRNALLTKVAAVSKDHKVRVEDDASLYMMSAIEDTLRGLLSRTLAAQVHRTSSSYLRTPPVRPSSSTGVKKETVEEGKGKDGKDPRPMWSHTITSDPNAVLELLSRQARDAEQEFRKARMDRLARDAEMQKARERANALALAHGGVVGGTGSGGGGGSSGGSSPLPPGTPGSTSAGAPPPSSPPHSTSTPAPAPSTPKPPTFGALKETPSGSSTPGSKKKSTAKKATSRDVSAEVQHKMTNATAMRSVGMGKKYGWMMGNAPAVSSPLAGKKRKAGAGPSALGESSLVPGEEGKKTAKGKGKGKGSKEGGEDGAGEGDQSEDGRPTKKQRPIPIPKRRLIPVDPIAPPRTAPGNPSTPAPPTEPRRVPDDRALTFVDFAFALEHGGLGAAGGQGAGSVSGEVLQKVWGRPGGAWGEGWELAEK